MFMKAIVTFLVHFVVFIASLQDSEIITNQFRKSLLQWKRFPWKSPPGARHRGQICGPSDNCRDDDFQHVNELSILDNGAFAPEPTRAPKPLLVMTVESDENTETVKETYKVVAGALEQVKILRKILWKVLESLKERNSCQRTPHKFNFTCCSKNIHGFKLCFDCRQELVGYSTGITFNDKAIFRRIAQGDMPFACSPFLKSLAWLTLCIKVYNVERSERRFHGCFFFTIRVLERHIVSFNFECVDINDDGTLKFMPPKNKPEARVWQVKPSKYDPSYNRTVDVVDEAQHFIHVGNDFLENKFH